MKYFSRLITIFSFVLAISAGSIAAQEDYMAGEPKENILLRLFPDDCITIYHLPVNRDLLAKEDSIHNRFYVFTIASRNKPGLARIIFDKLAEARIPDTVRYILFHIDFNYSGRNAAYTPVVTGSLNTDTLKGIFTKEMIENISNQFIGPELSHHVFNQPLNASTINGYNNALFLAFDELLKLYEDDRTIQLEQFIIKLLKKLNDSLSNEISGFQSRFQKLRKELINEASIYSIDTSLIFGMNGIFGSRGVSGYFEDPQDTATLKGSDQLDKLFRQFITTDFQIAKKDEAIGKIGFLLKEGSLPLTHHIKSILESENLLPDEMIENDKKEPVFSLIREFLDQYSLSEMESKYSDK